MATAPTAPVDSTPVADPLQVEHDEISTRLEKASEAEKPVLERQFGERLKHLTERLAQRKPAATPPVVPTKA